MSFLVAFYFAVSTILLTHSKVASVNGQCTTEGCAHDDLSMNIIAEIQQQNAQALSPLNKHIQNIRDLLISQHDAILKSLQAVDRRLEEHEIYIKQIQSSQEFINESLQEIKSLKAADRLSQGHNVCTKQIQSIYELLNESTQQRNSECDSVNLSLQALDQNLGNFQIDIKNQTQRTWKLVDDVCDPVGPHSVRDCSDIKARFYSANGVYEICVGHQPNRLCANAYCETVTTNVTSLVFQRRKDGSVNFNRTWAEYREGFGNPDGEFWLGNEMLYLLTSIRKYKLRVDLEDFNGTKRYAEYANFSISSSSDNYRLTFGKYSGSAGDSLNYHNGKQFTTNDADNDESPGRNCARAFGGGWWYYYCFRANPNGIYRQRNETFSNSMGIHWLSWHSTGYDSLKATEMKLVPVA